jgi:hypothetical protein
MLVTFTADRAWRRTGTVTVWLLLASCSLIVGELPEPLPDAGHSAGASAGEANCDADHDQHLAEGKCGGDDCDDSDANVFTGQAEYFDERQARVDYDYDCSGAPEQEQLEPIVCPGVPVGACPTTQMGFLQTLPPCGEPGVWGTCEKRELLCDEKPVDVGRIMRCR